jgi:hypothetical protein
VIAAGRLGSAGRAVVALQWFVVAATLVLVSGPLAAQKLDDEQHLYYHQGGIVIITGSRIEISYRSSFCVAEFSGFLLHDGNTTVAESDYSMGSTVCRVEITEREDGALVLAEEQACIAYHGLRCSFTGVVFPVDDLPEYIP